MEQLLAKALTGRRGPWQAGHSEWRKDAYRGRGHCYYLALGPGVGGRWEMQREMQECSMLNLWGLLEIGGK